MTENTYVPKNYEELYNVYFAEGKLGPALCKRMLNGKIRQDWEDANQEAYMRLFQAHIIEKFNPEKANFGGVIFFACRSACMNMGRRGARENNHLSLVERLDERIPGAISGERLRVDEGTENRLIAGLMTDYFKQIAQESKSISKAKRFQNLDRLIDCVLSGLDKQETAEALGISRASVDLWLEALGGNQHA